MRQKKKHKINDGENSKDEDHDNFLSVSFEKKPATYISAGINMKTNPNNTVQPYATKSAAATNPCIAPSVIRRIG